MNASESACVLVAFGCIVLPFLAGSAGKAGGEEQSNLRLYGATTTIPPGLLRLPMRISVGPPEMNQLKRALPGYAAGPFAEGPRMKLQHHILLGPNHLSGNGRIGRYVLLPGTRSRSAAIAAYLEDVQVVDNPRGHTAHLGVLRRDGAEVEVLVTSSGMGTASTEIILHELIEAGARRVVRVGSSGSMDTHIKAGDAVILTGAVRDELATRHIAPVEFPAVAHPTAVSVMVAGARSTEHADHTFLGIGHTKASLYAREFGHGPLGDQNRAYGEVLSKCGAVASDMEAAMLFIQASVRSAGQSCAVAQGNASVPVQAACVLGVYGDDDSEMDLDPVLCRLADKRAIEVTLSGIIHWARADGVI